MTLSSAFYGIRIQVSSEVHAVQDLGVERIQAFSNSSSSLVFVGWTTCVASYEVDAPQ
jgi:hypothetical protein